MSERLDSISEQLYAKESTKNPKEFIETIESDIPYIINHELEKKEDRVKVTRLISDYGLMLSQDGSYSKALKNINAGISLFHSDPNLDKNDLYAEPMYEVLIANRGMCNYNLRKFNSAKTDFSNLVKRFPDSENYIKWQSETNKRLAKTTERIFLVVIIVGAIFSWVFDRADGILFYLSISTLAIGLVGSITSEIIKRKNN